MWGGSVNIGWKYRMMYQTLRMAHGLNSGDHYMKNLKLPSLFAA